MNIVTKRKPDSACCVVRVEKSYLGAAVLPEARCFSPVKKKRHYHEDEDKHRDKKND
jgi:hypothetical protein